MKTWSKRFASKRDSQATLTERENVKVVTEEKMTELDSWMDLGFVYASLCEIPEILSSDGNDRREPKRHHKFDQKISEFLREKLHKNVKKIRQMHFELLSNLQDEAKTNELNGN